jgi:KaiC/GvpD/RAD55 family RecA-like ATPase
VQMQRDSKYPTPYWSEWSDRIIQAYNLKQTAKGEYHGPCPSCGGVDRFWISEKLGEVKAFCRQGCDIQTLSTAMIADGVWPTVANDDWPEIRSEKNPFSDVTPQPYNVRKGVELIGAMLDGDTVVVPIFNSKREKVGIQRITPDGQKRFSKGMEKEGAFGVVGKPEDGTVYIAEGWATSVSVHMATGRPVIFGLDAGNLAKVAKELPELFPDAEFVVAADNDDKGIDAAKATGFPYVCPKGRAGRDWNDVHVEEGVLSVKKQLTTVRKPKPLFVPLGSLEFRKPQWIIDGLLEKNAFAVCFGSPAAGKTFLVLDMALCIASGADFHGHAVDKGPVFYIAGEGHNGFARRAAAWSKVRGVDLRDLPFFKSSRSIVLTEEESVDTMLDVVDEMARQYGNPAVVIIDTLARSMGAADENSTQAMGGMIATVDEIRERYETTVLAVHHTGHGAKDRARGSSALLGAVDAEFKVEKWGGNKVEVSFTKMKDATTPEPMNFIHMDVELMDADMNEAQSIVLEKIADSRNDNNSKDSREGIIKLEIERETERTGDKWVSRSVIKANAALELNVSHKTIDRTIKSMIDVQDLLYDNNKLALVGTS